MKQPTKTNQKRKRGKRGEGRLYKRAPGGKEHPADSPINAPYWLAYTIPSARGGRGQRVRQPLHDQHGKPITDKKKAEAERKRIMAPYSAGSRVEALKAIKAKLREAEDEQSHAIEEANPPLLLKDSWQAYMDSPERPQGSGELTLKRYRGHHDRFCEWVQKTDLDMQYMRDITPAVARSYSVDLTRAGFGPNTYNKHIGFLKLLFRVLADEARTRVNPFEKVKSKELKPNSRRELTIQELAAILDTADGELSLLLYLGAATGLRLGDCATLQWKEVDLTKRVIRRIPNKTAKKGQQVLVGIPPALHAILSETPKTRRKGDALPNLATKYARDVAIVTNAVKDHFLDCGIDVHAKGTGHRIKRKDSGEPERKAETGKVILEDTGKPAIVEVGFHSLRHTYVSLHAERGTPQAIIQANVGHASPAMTRHYTHISEATAIEVAAALPAFRGEQAAKDKDEPTHAPLPSWATKLVETLDSENWQSVKEALLERGAA